MSFRFKRKEKFARGFHRIAADEIARAQAAWADADRPRAVHETRKCVKRLRALLRLTRPSMAKQAFRAENAYLRDVAGALSSTRDADVMRATIAKLAAAPRTPEALLPVLNRLAAAVDARRGKSGPGAGPGQTSAASDPAVTADRLAEAGERLAAIKLEASGFDTVAQGFEDNYRRGRELMAEVERDVTAEASHEWRKAVQAHWRQLALLAAAWPEFFRARISVARRLSEALGHVHDLDVLAEFAATALSADDAAAVEEVIAGRRERLMRDAMSDGRLLYADRPSDLLRRVRQYWQVARSQQATTSGEASSATTRAKDGAATATAAPKSSAVAQSSGSQTSDSKPSAGPKRARVAAAKRKTASRSSVASAAKSPSASVKPASDTSPAASAACAKPASPSRRSKVTAKKPSRKAGTVPATRGKPGPKTVR